MKKARMPLIAMLLVLAALTAVFCTSCESYDEMNPVILKLGDMTLTKFYFDSLYATNDDYYKMSQGAISMSDYFDSIVEDVGRYAVTLKTARDRGFTLSDEEQAKIEQDYESQWEHIRQIFREKVNSSITDEAEIESEIERLFEIDTGYTSEVYRESLKLTLADRELVRKLFEDLTKDIEPTEKQVRKYIELKVNSESQAGFATFAQRFNAYAEGTGDPFLFIPAECFTVDQFMIDTTDTTASAARISTMDEKLDSGLSSQQFMESVASDENDDENMRDEKHRDLGYLMHDSMKSSYSIEFYYAAYRASGKKVAPGVEIMSAPDLQLFTTTDNKLIARVAEESCVRYVILNRRYVKGNVSYKIGDDIWNYGYEGAKAEIRQKNFDQQADEWYAKDGRKIRWYLDRIKKKYVPS